MDEIDRIDREIEYEKQKTQLKKENFIKEIKSGLGQHIKNNGGRVKKIKKTRIRLFWERLMDIF